MAFLQLDLRKIHTFPLQQFAALIFQIQGSERTPSPPPRPTPAPPPPPPAPLPTPPVQANQPAPPASTVNPPPTTPPTTAATPPAPQQPNNDPNSSFFRFFIHHVQTDPQARLCQSNHTHSFKNLKKKLNLFGCVYRGCSVHFSEYNSPRDSFTDIIHVFCGYNIFVDMVTTNLAISEEGTDEWVIDGLYYWHDGLSVGWCIMYVLLSTVFLPLLCASVNCGFFFIRLFGMSA